MPCGRARTYPPCTSFTPSIEFLATRWKAAGGTVCKRLFTTPDSPLWYIFAPPLTHSTVKKERQPGVPVPVGHSRDAKNTRLPSEGIDPARRLRKAAALRSLPYLGEGHPSIFNFHQRLLSFRRASGFLPQKITRRTHRRMPQYTIMERVCVVPFPIWRR